jgi:spore germination cell wall hydrolase CwlJ-like protein
MRNVLIAALLISPISANAEQTFIDISPRAEVHGVHPPRLADINLPSINSVQTDCLAQAIYFEGGNQTVMGMAAIGHVIMNRVESTRFPDTVCAVVHQGPRGGGPITRHRCQFSYFCDGKSDVFPISNNIAEVEAADMATATANRIMYGIVADMTDGADHYHANYVTPGWADGLNYQSTIGDHLFYVDDS